jgi:hypothetical protein
MITQIRIFNYYFTSITFVYMGKKIEVNKFTTREHLDMELSKLPKRNPINLAKYFNKIAFGIDGLQYQLEIRKEWR